MTEFRIEPLHGRHQVEDFDCGQDAVNRYLIRFALMNQRTNAARTYIGLVGERFMPTTRWPSARWHMPMPHSA